MGLCSSPSSPTTGVSAWVCREHTASHKTYNENTCQVCLDSNSNGRYTQQKCTVAWFKKMKQTAERKGSLSFFLQANVSKPVGQATM